MLFSFKSKTKKVSNFNYFISILIFFRFLFGRVVLYLNDDVKGGDLVFTNVNKTDEVRCKCPEY